MDLFKYLKVPQVKTNRRSHSTRFYWCSYPQV